MSKTNFKIGDEIIISIYGKELQTTVVGFHPSQDSFAVLYSDGWPITVAECSFIDEKYLGQKAWWVDDMDVRHAKSSTTSKSPIKCILCKAVHDYAEPNLTDGKFACYSCRTGGEKYKLVGLL